MSGPRAPRMIRSILRDARLNSGSFICHAVSRMETNPLHNQLNDLRSRTVDLRGYL